MQVGETGAAPPLPQTKGEADGGGCRRSGFKADAEASFECLSVSEFIMIHISLLQCNNLRKKRYFYIYTTGAIKPK